MSEDTCCSVTQMKIRDQYNVLPELQTKCWASARLQAELETTIIIIIIINCNWVSTRRQCSVYKYKKHKH
jgi:hypothetical protein